MLRVQTKSLFSGELNMMDIPATYEQQGRWLDRESIAVAMPDAKPEHVAFLASGMTLEERRTRFGDAG